MPARPPNGRHVKSGISPAANDTADGHERAKAAAVRARLQPVHPHMLRHSCGFALADKGDDLRLIQDFLGHRDPRQTVHYTRVAGRRFEGLWR
jgi:site-specific recombinase XerD